MKFKSATIMQQYEILPEKLKEICDEFDKLAKDNGITAIVTRVSDPVEGESGVHLDHRAVDFRNQYNNGTSLVCLFPMELVEEIVETINTLYVRQDKYKTIIHHSFNGGMYHFHLQIPYGWVTDLDRRRIKNAAT